MSLIIDGHNLIGVLPDLSLADPDDELSLLARLRLYRSTTDQNIIVFFDSGDMPAHFPDLSTAGVKVHFALPGQTADDAIVEFLRDQREPGQYAVVTNDTELAARARRAGASVQRASDFAARLARPAARRAPSARSLNAGPNPHDPAFADLYGEFLRAEHDERTADERFGADLHAGPALWIERLYGDDVLQAQRAAAWLGRYGGAAALAPLRDALTHEDVAVRAAAVWALADLKDPAVVPDLAGRLAGDASGRVRVAAAEALARFDGPGVEAALEAAAAGDSKAKVRKAARFALVQVRARARRS